jgi:hypothetical protein
MFTGIVGLGAFFFPDVGDLIGMRSGKPIGVVCKYDKTARIISAVELAQSIAFNLISARIIGGFPQSSNGDKLPDQRRRVEHFQQTGGQFFRSRRSIKRVVVAQARRQAKHTAA